MQFFMVMFMLMYFKAARPTDRGQSHTSVGQEIHRVPLLDVYRKNSEQPVKPSLLREYKYEPRRSVKLLSYSRYVMGVFELLY